jgi:RNA polymerase sigma-70 factor (ECF subfamily)
VSDDEAELIRRAQQWDRAAITEIYERHQPQIYRYILYRVQDADLAGELTGEVFLRLVEHIPRFTYRGRPLLAWLYTIARNLIADTHRQARRIYPVPVEDLPPASRPEPFDPTEQWLTRQRLEQALAYLTEEQYEVILLRFVEGVDIESVARLLGKSVRAVKSLQYRGLRALRQVLERNGW